MNEEFEAVIGLEVHAEMQTLSKMFCSCAVVDSTQVAPNTAVCPVCAALPGALPVANQKAVEYALSVALAVQCQVNRTSIFARKNYFYPDLPKGYQISQYEEPLAVKGFLAIQTSQGERIIRIHRIHIEEDTGKLTHINKGEDSCSLIDLNRAGVPLLEIVSEPDMHSSEEARAYAASLRAVLRYLGVNSGDMQKGVIRFEANVSVRLKGSQSLNTRVEIKNLNSFRALERSIDYEIQRQIHLYQQGGKVDQETLGWDEMRNQTYTQRSKEHAHDYRYFPEPDLPPLIVEEEWLEKISSTLPELPASRILRFQQVYGLNAYDANTLVTEQAVADYYERCLTLAKQKGLLTENLPKIVLNWITGELFALLNRSADYIQKDDFTVPVQSLVGLLVQIEAGEINQNTAKTVLAQMFAQGKTAEEIIEESGLHQISDMQQISALVRQTIAEQAAPVTAYLNGKETLFNWLFGQVMRCAQGKANPQMLRKELESQLNEIRIIMDVGK